MTSSTSSRAQRPSFGPGALQRSPSYLDDHLEYRSHQSGPVTSIDGILEQPSLGSSPTRISPALPLSARRSISIDPPTQPPQTSFDAVHTLSHTNCISDKSTAQKLVATIYYNSAQPQHAHDHSDKLSAPGPTDALPPASIADGLAPTTSLSAYPLEPPAPEPEPLDHIYGSYVSQMCLTHFLATLDSLLIHNAAGDRRLQSSHKCLAPDSGKPSIVEVTFSPPPNPQYLPFNLISKHESIFNFEREWNCEVIFQYSSIYRHHKRLCVFDMDSTLIQQEVIDEIAAYIGIKDQVSAITERAMNGELDFSASLKARVALLKGVPSDVFERLKPKITITPGARELCKVLRRLGLQLAVISGGFQPLADWLKDQLGLDYAFANHLLSDPVTGTLTGELDPSKPIVNAEHKQGLLISLAKGRDIPLAQTMAVGDGANDLPMLMTAGLGVAWKAKPKVQMEAPARLNVGRNMLDLVYLLGLTQAEVEELLSG